jgi:hypothetical protein
MEHSLNLPLECDLACYRKESPSGEPCCGSIILGDDLFHHYSNSIHY